MICSADHLPSFGSALTGILFIGKSHKLSPDKPPIEVTPWAAFYPVPSRGRGGTGSLDTLVFGSEGHWLGPWGSPEARLRYDTLVAAWITSGRKSTEAAATPKIRPATVPVDLTVAELATLWLDSIAAARPDDYQKSSTWNGALAAARALRKYAALPAREFGPRHLIECRQTFAAGTVRTLDKSGKVVSEWPRTRRYVNDIAARIVQLFSWAVPRELVPPDRAAGLRLADV